jgi:ribonuclease BN (tRNA processing enzyme)
MEMTVLGSGTAIPRPDRGSPGCLVRAGGRRILVDCGPGTMRAAAAQGVGPGDVDFVVVTHFHPDHNLDLLALLFALGNRLYRGRPPLAIVAPDGFGEILAHWLSGVQGPWLAPEHYELELLEIGEGEYDLGGVNLQAIHVEHTPQSLGYRFSERPGGPVIAISGDTAVCDGVVAVGRHADLFLLECAVPDADPFGKHLTPATAAEVAARAAPKRLILTHFYPDVEAEPILDVVRAGFAGEVELAEDGRTWNVF